MWVGDTEVHEKSSLFPSSFALFLAVNNLYLKTVQSARLIRIKNKWRFPFELSGGVTGCQCVCVQRRSLKN